MTDTSAFYYYLLRSLQDIPSLSEALHRNWNYSYIILIFTFGIGNLELFPEETILFKYMSMHVEM